VASDVVRNKKRKQSGSNKSLESGVTPDAVVSLWMRWCHSGCDGHPESIKKEALDAVGIQNQLKKKLWMRWASGMN